MTSKVTYLGDLRTSSIHLQSGSEIISDAPLDNNGKGEAFSPTDTVANALASCMMTVMGIKARDLNVDFVGSTASVTKIMQAEPRRIGAVEIVFDMKGVTDEKTKTIIITEQENVTSSENCIYENAIFNFNLVNQIAAIAYKQGIQSILIEGEGVLIAKDDTHDFADKVSVLLSDATKRQMIGERGRQYAQEKWGAGVLAKKVAKFYKSTINQKSSLTRYMETRIGNAKGTT